MSRAIVSSRWILASVLATAVAVSSAALATPATFAQNARSVTGGELKWGLKESFRNYITGRIAHGSAEPGDGASTDASGSYVFPAKKDTQLSGDTVEIPFQGSVHFTGHNGILDLQISDFKMRLTNGSTDAALVVDAVSNEFISTHTAGDPITYSDVDLANVTLASAPDLSANSVDLTSTAVTLTEQGVPAFGGFYKKGQELDNTAGMVSLGAAKAAEASDTPTKTTGSSSSAAAESSEAESATSADPAGIESSTANNSSSSVSETVTPTSSKPVENPRDTEKPEKPGAGKPGTADASLSVVLGKPNQPEAATENRPSAEKPAPAKPGSEKPAQGQSSSAKPTAAPANNHGNSGNNAQDPNHNGGNLAKTGVNNALIAVLALALTAAAGSVLLLRKRA